MLKIVPHCFLYLDFLTLGNCSFYIGESNTIKQTNLSNSQTIQTSENGMLLVI